MIQRLAIPLLAILCFAPAAAQEPLLGWYPEGPAWIGGDLYWAEMNADRVFRMENGTREPFLQGRPCGPTAISRYREDEFIVLCHLEGRLLHMAADGGILDEITQISDGTQLRNPNDASADGQGGVWFTDPGQFSVDAEPEGRLYHLAPDGSLTMHADSLAYGNGVHVDQAGARLLLSEHLARKVWSYAMVGNKLGPRELLIDLDKLEIPKPRYPEAGPDGLELGPDGTLWVAEYGSKRLLGWQPERGLVAALEVDAPYVTNIAFGGKGQAVITGSYTNHEPHNRGGIWLFDAQILTDAAAPR
ncbi:MAG: SMP-30/gluconolactonase/LRE family protein [Paracoccaceae bacterium]